MGDDWEDAHAAALESMREGEFLVHPHAQVVDGAQDGHPRVIVPAHPFHAKVSCYH